MRRRDFLKTVGRTAAVSAMGATLVRPKRALAGLKSNEKIIIAVIGCGGMGGRHIRALAKNDQCNIAAVCDVFMPRCHEAARAVEKATGKAPDEYQDFRHILDRKDIDAIFAPSPDHWHALMTIMGCQAGKDVYVEKPVSTTVEEGRAMVNAARRYGRVVQVGTQQRSMPVFQQAMEIIHSGKIGKVTTATAWLGQNWTGILDFPEPVPEGLDWDLFLGPAPEVPYSPQRQYSFRSWHDYARGGQLTNWGVHLFDVLHWGIGQEQPLNVQSVGGCYTGWPQSDDYETIDSIFEYQGCTLTWEQRHTNVYEGFGLGMKFQGTEGQLLVDRNTYKVIPKNLDVKPYDGPGEEDWANPDHHNNFFHCIRTRQRPVADIEQGHRSTIPMLLAGIALKVKRKLNWDGQAERFINDEQADRHLSRAYRAPWHL